MRQVLAIVAGGLLAGIGAVVLGEYDLRGSTAIVGFPLYGLAVTEVALAVGKRLAPLTLAAAAAAVAGGLTWALWISFGHFRNDVFPPALSWAMVGVAVATTVFWGRSGRRRTSPAGDDAAPAPVAQQSPQATSPDGPALP